MGLSDFDWILPAFRTANLESKGRIEATTSMASSPRHKAKPFCCTLSSRHQLLLHCQIVEPYTISTKKQFAG